MQFILTLKCTIFFQICQRMMVQGLPRMATYNGPFDAVRNVLRTEGFRGLYRGFGLTAVTQSPASALWWGTYGSAQHVIWRYTEAAYYSKFMQIYSYLYSENHLMFSSRCLFGDLLPTIFILGAWAIEMKQRKDHVIWKW